LEFDVAGPVRITCARGLSPTLEEEVTALGFPVAGTHDTWVDTEASLGEAMRLNLHLRTAYHVLYRLRSFACEGPEDLYQGVRAHAWEEVVPADGYVSVATRGDAPGVRNTMFATLKVKDAIVDRIQAEAGRRPDSGPERDRAVVTLYWVGRRATLYLDTSGRKLSDRGYRRQPHEAPLRETLAAAVLLELGYTGDAPLVNPMCGSGTLAIEAGLIAARRAPGRDREHGFMHVLGYDAAAWRTLLAEARAAERPRSWRATGARRPCGRPGATSPRPDSPRPSRSSAATSPRRRSPTGRGWSCSTRSTASASATTPWPRLTAGSATSSSSAVRARPGR